MSRGIVKWIGPRGYGFVDMGEGDSRVMAYAPAHVLEGLEQGEEVDVMAVSGGTHGLVVSEIRPVTVQRA